MIKNLIIGALAIGIVCWTLNACSAKTKNNKEKVKPVVAVSIPPQLFFIKAIAGDRVQTVCLLGNSSDPETFEPSMSQLVGLEEADVFMPIGVLPFEEVLAGRLKANKKNLEIANVSDGIDILTGTHGHHHGEGHNHNHAIAAADPHVWSSPRNAKVMALNTLEALIKADSINEDVYRANYQRLYNRIDSVDQSFQRAFSAPDAPRSFIVWHPSLSYFARDYGLSQVSLSTDGKESSVKGLVDRLKSASGSGSVICFYQKEFDTERAAAFGNELGVKIVEINSMNEEWEDEMQKLYDAFTIN